MRTRQGEDLRSLRFLTPLSPSVRSELIGSGEIKALPKGAVLWRRGERARYAFVILSGRVGLFDGLEEDRATVIDFYHPGDAVLGMPVLDAKATYTFSGQALDDVSVLSIPIQVYRRHMQRDNTLLFGTALNMAEAWRRLIVQIRNLKRLSANRRLGFYLLALTDRRSGAATVRLADDQLIVAGMLGVTRESLSRSFAQLRTHGVHKRGRAVTIADVARLRSYCADDGDD